MDLGISGRRVAVAASSKGLGLASAMALAAEGAHVVVSSRTALAVDEAVARIIADGGRAWGVVADVSTGEGGADFVARAAEALGGPVEILVTNAGGPPAGTFAGTALDAYPAALELNLLSVVGMCKVAVPSMVDAAWGRVLAITSVSVRQPIPHLILSNTARAGVTGFLKTLAREVAASGVTVNSVQPGAHATDRLMSVYGDKPEAAAAGIPAGTVGDPWDFGKVVAFMCSQQAKFVTGTHVQVDGGAYAGLL